MEQIKIDVVKQWLKNKKEFSPLDVIEKLEKENAELLDKLNLQNQRLNELKKENAELKEQINQLSNDNHVLKTSFILQQEQIEKMKCCYNCSKWNDGQCKDFNDSYYYVMADYNCDKWELAE